MADTLLSEKGVILAHRSRVQALMVEKGRQQASEASAHISCTIREQREVNVCKFEASLVYIMGSRPSRGIQ